MNEGVLLLMVCCTVAIAATVVRTQLAGKRFRRFVVSCLVLGIAALVMIPVLGTGAVVIQGENGTTVEATPQLTVDAQDAQFQAGNQTTLDLRVGNQGAEFEESHPAEVRGRITTAYDVRVSISENESIPLTTTTNSQSLGNLTAEEQIRTTTFDIVTFTDAQPGEYDLEVAIEYTNVNQITYGYLDDDTLVTEERRSSETETVTVTVTIGGSDTGGGGGGGLLSILYVLPPIFVVVVTSTWLGGKVSSRLERRTNKVSRVFFGRFISGNTERGRRIESAFIETTYRTYAAKTYLYAVLGFLAGTIAGAYLLAGIIAVLEPIIQALAGLPRTMTAPLGIHPNWQNTMSSRTRWLIIIVGGFLIGLLTSVLAYTFRWQLPSSDAEVRRRAINEGLPRTTAFMYALSRGGMEFPQILRTLTEHREVYGETANEMSITVREMDLFGRDMISALRRMSKRTPSEQFKTFSENLTSVLQSGSDLSEFLNDQYSRFRQEAEDRQEDILELLSTIAEGYVTVLVAGVLFLITILLVFGLTTTDTLWVLKLLIYIMIPLANIGFAVFLQQKLDQLGIAKRSGGEVLDQMEAETPTQPETATRQTQPDGGVASQREQENRRVLKLSDKVTRVKRAIRNPLQVFLWNPTKLFWVTVPVALVLFLFRVPTALQAEGITFRILDDLLIQSALLLLITYAIIREIYKRRIDRIEAATPELLERLASLNEAGMSVVEGLDRVRGSDLGVLSPEVERIWRDIEYGANVDDALIRFGRRVRTTAITRVVTLLTNAMRASGEMGPVLRIASEQARAEVDLRKQRRQQMFTYLVVIYVSFMVFLVIIVAVNEVLVPSLPDTVPTGDSGQVNRLGASPDAFTRFGEVNKASYTLVFFHAALLQSVAAGFIGGQLGEGSLRDGAKHAAIMLTIAYLIFILLSSPVASITVTADETTSTGNTIYVDSVSISSGGFIAVYDSDGLSGELLGYTTYLPPGTHSGITIPLQNGEITENQEIRIVAHKDTNGNEQFDFQTSLPENESASDTPYQSLSDKGTPGSSVNVIYVGDDDDE